MNSPATKRPCPELMVAEVLRQWSFETGFETIFRRNFLPYRPLASAVRKRPFLRRAGKPLFLSPWPPVLIRPALAVVAQGAQRLQVAGMQPQVPMAMQRLDV